MKTKLYLLFFFVFPLFMSACRGDDPIPDPPVDGKRTVLVYMAADNSINPLASFTDGDLEELKAGMASIDNTSDMHLLVYIDTGFPRLIEIENKGGTVVETIVKEYEDRNSCGVAETQEVFNDGSGKDEGELTGGKRLIEQLKKRHGHFADVIVADALYLNAPFINTLKENGLEGVIRLKDERRMIFQDAERLFKQDEGKKASFWKGKKKIEVWDLSGFKMEGCPYKLRVVRYHEQWEENGKETERFMWLVTTLEAADYRVLWEMMHRRWDIEENGFHQLKTYYHAKHCYCRDAVETIFNLIIIGFNVRELYLYRRSRNFAGSGISRKSINRIFCDDLLTEKVKQILCEKGG